MNSDHRLVRVSLCLLLVLSTLTLLFTLSGMADERDLSNLRAEPTGDPATVFLPLVVRNHPWASPFGTETQRKTVGDLLGRAEELDARWIRLHRVSWRAVQPIENGPYDWNVLSSFEDELRAMRQVGLTPIVIIQHSPQWATVNEPFETDCGAIREDKFGAFAQFMQALVERYKQPEFGVRYWELGNEPDVAPTLVGQDYPFGCWGDLNDPYYGGGHYGQMLKVVTPAIKAVDERAQVMIGGLLLSSPNTTTPGLGKPELFLKGILEVGAAPYFDIVAYHSYPVYVGKNYDYDNEVPSPWKALGGWALGKARYLRATMDEYGVSKPLFLNETALGCEAEWFDFCNPPSIDFYEAQANFLIRTFTRALSEDIQGIMWYTLDGPAWRYVSLLDDNGDPRLAYLAYQQLIARLSNSQFEQPVYYGAAVEAYSFVKGSKRVHVIWSRDTVGHVVSVPQSLFLGAYDRNGDALLPTPSGANNLFTATFSPIYIELGIQ